MPEKNLCSHCEYGNRFTDLGACPECADGRVVGDFHTRGIFCSTGHRITSVAVDFCGKQNCENLTIWQEYTIRLCTLPDGKRLASAAKLLGMTRTQIFRMFKNGTPIEPDPRMGMRFDRMLETAAQLALDMTHAAIVETIKGGEPLRYGMQFEKVLPLFWKKLGL